MNTGSMDKHVCLVPCSRVSKTLTVNTGLEHWLPISQRITFKIVLMVFDCSRGRCPKYFSDVYIPVHTVTVRLHLRSADHGDLVVPHVLSRFGCRSFRVSGPTIWNNLPVDIRSTDIMREQFKRSLKIWLFECAYGRRRV